MSFGTFVQFLIQALNIGLIYSLPALAISLIWNAAGLFNFAQSDLLVVGGYLMYTMLQRLGLDYIGSLIGVVALMGAVGYFLSSGYFYPMIAQRQDKQKILIGTVALSVFLKNFELLVWGATGNRFNSPVGTSPIELGKILIMPSYVFNIVVIVVLVVVLQFFLRHTIIGTAMRAVAQNDKAAALMGVRVSHMVALTVSIAATLSAIGGILITPQISMTPELSGALGAKAFAAVLIGGLGSFSGALVGGIIVGVSEVFFSALFGSAFKDVFVYLLLIVLLMIRPDGIFKSKIVDKA